MEPEVQMLIDVAEAFALNGYNIKAHFGNIIEREEIDPALLPQYFLAAKTLVRDELSDSTQGNLFSIRCTLYTIADKPDNAVNENIKFLKNVFVSEAGFVGAGNRPVEYGGVQFWRFEPTFIPMSANEFNGLWITETDLTVTAKK